MFMPARCCCVLRARYCRLSMTALPPPTHGAPASSHRDGGLASSAMRCAALSFFFVCFVPGGAPRAPGGGASPVFGRAPGGGATTFRFGGAPAAAGGGGGGGGGGASACAVCTGEWLPARDAGARAAPVPAPRVDSTGKAFIDIIVAQFAERSLV